MLKPVNLLRRYHYKVYFPDNTPEMCFEFLNKLPFVKVTYHAAYQMLDDPRCIIDLPSKQDLINDTNRLIEFYENLNALGQPNNTIQKILLRVSHLHEKFDFTYLVAREGYIVSAWCLDKNDEHRLTKALFEYYCPVENQHLIYSKIKAQKLLRQTA